MTICQIFGHGDSVILKEEKSGQNKLHLSKKGCLVNLSLTNIKVQRPRMLALRRYSPSQLEHAL